jgi:hypothetical protein
MRSVGVSVFVMLLLGSLSFVQRAEANHDGVRISVSDRFLVSRDFHQHQEFLARDGHHRGFHPWFHQRVRQNPFTQHQFIGVPKVWVPAQWVWNGWQWVWVPGHWVW